jgi:hypothetical protein
MVQPENNNEEPLKTPSQNGAEEEFENPWPLIVRDMWEAPLGVFGIILTTISICLMVMGFFIDLFDIINNPFVGVLTYMILPFCMIAGLLIIPLAVYLRNRKLKDSPITEETPLNLKDHKDRRFVTVFVMLTIINVAVLIIAGYEGYRFTDSNYFCALLCHKVMEPEYSSYQRSPHSRISCVECHIGRGAEWFVQTKLSGIPMVFSTLSNNYNKPIPTPVTDLRPAQGTCEKCHWPDKFHGKVVRKFYYFTNEKQENPTVKEVALHIGGRNPNTGQFEGIHWHVSKDVRIRYLAADRKLTRIASVKVNRPDGSKEEFKMGGLVREEGYEIQWRVMDCLDCHNRPTHVFQMPKDIVDFGLLSRKLPPELQGIRDDSLIVLQRKYNRKEEAKRRIPDHLFALRGLRGEVQKDEKKIKEAANYLVEAYSNNIWPEMNIWWGTYKGHLGHQFEEEGYGCFRCHDDKHLSNNGQSISKECDLCHDRPLIKEIRI